MGQIAPDSSFGRVLEALAADDRYATFVDVGTWDGLGTTRCLVNGTRYRKTPVQIWSYEASVTQYEVALQNWSSCPTFLHLVHGTLHREIADITSLHDHPGIQRIRQSFGTGYSSWHIGERESLVSAPLVDPPSSVDVIVLDGGEFTTKGDWDVLKTRNPRVVALDDTMVFKTHDIRNELLKSPEWKVVKDVPGERNGWAVFKRVDVFQDE